MVKFLLQSGADVNAVTSTNSTSLRAACFDGHLDIVEYLIENGADLEIANQHNHTCLMIACYKKHFEIVKVLVKNGAQVNRRSRKGNTALHDCAEGGCVEIMKFLLDNGATFQRDEYNVSPLMAAAISAHTSVVRFIMDTYITPITDETVIAEEVDRGSRISPREQIDVLEMLGCSMIDKKQDLLEGLKWWRRASEMRTLYHSVGLVELLKDIAQPVEEMENIVEYQSVEDVEEMMQEYNPDHIRMQSLLVRQRLLGFKHPDTTYYIRYRGAVLADSGDYERCLELWRYVLRNLVNNLDPLCCNILLCAIQSYVELFGFLFYTQKHDRFRQVYPTPSPNLVKLEDVLSVLQACIVLYKFHKKTSSKNPVEQSIAYQNKTDHTCMKLMCKLVVYFSLVKEDDLKQIELKSDSKKALDRVELFTEQMESLLSDIISYDIRDGDGNTLLHVIMSSDCCGAERHRITEYPHLPAIEIMLKLYRSVIYDLDLGNKEHFSALELFFKQSADSSECKQLQQVLDLFENYGSHIDYDAETRTDFCPLLKYNDRALKYNESQEYEKFLAIADDQEVNEEDFEKLPLKIRSLKCLSAKAVLENDCDFSQMCEHLRSYVLKH